MFYPDISNSQAVSSSWDLIKKRIEVAIYIYIVCGTVYSKIGRDKSVRDLKSNGLMTAKKENKTNKQQNKTSKENN